MVAPSPPAVPTATLELARASYERCSAVPDFYACFYRNFFRAAPEVEPRFAQTDFRRQHQLLKHALGLLLAFPTRPDDGPVLLMRVADRHSRRDLGIRPDLYPRFVDALVQTVAEHDVAFTPHVADAWRVAIAPGIAFMQGRY
ncbi:MAG TPA: globin [Gemmatimonadales bacterium]|nr:globin [Gemmatimonadales bacterium]